MKFNFLKNGYSNLMDSNVFNTFGLYNNDFFVSESSDLILVFKNELKEHSDFIQSELSRYSFKKAIKEEAEAPLVNAETNSEIMRELINDSYDEAFSFNGKLLPNPNYSIGNGNCAYAFVVEDGKVNLSIPNFFITIVKEIGTCKDTESSLRYCIDLRAAKLIKTVFGDCDTVKAYYNDNRNYYVFESDTKKVIVKVKTFNGNFAKHIQAMKIASSVDMTYLDRERLNNLVKEYSEEDYLNSDVKYVANQNYIFNIKEDDYYIMSDINSDTDCYENNGHSAVSDKNFTTSFEIIKAVLKEIPGELRYVKFSTSMPVDNVDKEWFEETNIFASSDNKTAIYFN